MRVYCPVQGCPCSDSHHHKGWPNDADMLKHIDAHLSGKLKGGVLDAWMAAHRKTRCRICRLSVSTQVGTHPTCTAAERAGRMHGQGLLGQRPPRPQSSADLPALHDVFSGKARTLKYVPAMARTAWATVLAGALAVAVAFNSIEAWQELAMLPGCVLRPPPYQSHPSSGHDCFSSRSHQPVASWRAV